MATFQPCHEYSRTDPCKKGVSGDLLFNIAGYLVPKRFGCYLLVWSAICLAALRHDSPCMSQ
jgi:hypothetical protein